MKIGSLCTGYGGLDLAVEAVTGGHTVWYSEFDKQAAKIMEHHRPDLKNLWDLTKVDWATVEPIDILTAGYPCQPFSGAGQRKGTNDPRHIWPSIAEAIRLLQPNLVVLENVRGHLSLGFGEVLGDLYILGYDAKWRIIRASDVGAPHQRARLFIVAYPKGSRWRSQQNRQGASVSTSANGLGLVNQPNDSSITDTNDQQPVGEVPGSWGRSIARFELRLSEERPEIVADPNSNAHEESRRVDRSIRSATGEIINGTDRQINWGRYQDAITRWEQLTRKAPHPVSDDRLEPKFVEWMMGLPNGWVTGTSLSRTQQLKALGNGVVPQQAEHALKLLLK